MDIQDHLPLTETTFLILLSLSPGPRHGYAIMKDVQALSDGRTVLSTGTLYGALKRLLDQGWIRRIEEPRAQKTERERKAYILTQNGRLVLKADAGRLRRLTAAAAQRRVLDMEGKV